MPARPSGAASNESATLIEPALPSKQVANAGIAASSDFWSSSRLSPFGSPLSVSTAAGGATGAAGSAAGARSEANAVALSQTGRLGAGFFTSGFAIGVGGGVGCGRSGCSLTCVHAAVGQASISARATSPGRRQIMVVSSAPSAPDVSQGLEPWYGCAMRIGIDLGGTKIEGVALDDAGGERARFRIPTPQHDYPATLEAIVWLVDRLEQAAGDRGTIGVGIPGVVSPATGLVKNANSVWLIGHPLDRDLEQRLGRPVRVANDANCFALSEAADGAGAPPRWAATSPHVVFGVIIGTGVGGGVVVDGKVLAGRNAIAGEWGHNPLPWPRPDEYPGPACYCGRLGCIETFLSGPGLSRDHQSHGGDKLDASTIVQQASAGDAAADASLSRYEDRMARALASVLNVIDPDVVVLGGGLSKIERLYRNVPELWVRHAFSDAVRTHLRPPRHGDSSGVRGAAWLWPVQGPP